MSNNKIAFAPSLDGWSPPILIEDVNTGTIHASSARRSIAWCNLAPISPSVTDPDWKGRLNDLCRDCFDVYIQESLL